MILFLAYTVFVLALAISMIAAGAWYQDVQYQIWTDQMNDPEIDPGDIHRLAPQVRLEPVYLNNEVVGYAQVVTRRSKAR
jgi:hypothetical protein